MKALNKSFSRGLACALAGALIAFVYAVLRVEPVAHDASLSAWQWFWHSYGLFFRRGLLIGGLTGLALLRLWPAASRRWRSV